MKISQNDILDLMIKRIGSSVIDLENAFAKSISTVGVRYVVIDDLLPDHIAHDISMAFPHNNQMRLMSSFREKKFTSKNLDQFNPILGDVTFAIQDPRMVEIVEQVTGIKEQVPDQLLYAGGLSAMARGHFLSPHIDNSHDSTRQFYRTLNLLYYLTPDWQEEGGGNLQLWNRNVDSSVTIHARFNRMVLMETSPWSWHSVNKVTQEGSRKCLSNYYFSRRSPIDRDYFNITAFSAPPNQPFLRLFSKADAAVRQCVRLVKPSGIGKLDVYDGAPR